MKAMIFAAGLGTRLRPITDNIPKALVPICGKPLLYHVIKRLQSFGVQDFTVNAHHFADQIIKYLSDTHFENANIALSIEKKEPLETGGGILAAKNSILSAPGDGFIAHNVDILSDLDINWFVSQIKPESIATLLVSERDTQRYLLFDDDMRLVGWTNIATGEVRSPYSKLDPSKYRKYAFSGIHYLSDSVFQVMESTGFSGRFPIMDFYLQMARIHDIRGVAPAKLEIVDVGKLSTLSAAEDFILRHSVQRNCPEGA